MNIHPLFVHFPIAFFVLYAAIELCTPRQKIGSPWHLIKTVLLVAWSIGAQFALATGDMAEQLAGHSPMLEMHSLFAGITTAAFGINAALYVWEYAIQKWDMLRKYTLVRYIDTFVNFLRKIYIHIILAVVGLIAVTYTGALGGAMVYGANVDPVVHFLLTTVGL